tara:strand:- start:199 stop:321 length:123 start_codon:yes stop_codon:yes gene_type:complete
MQISNKWKKIIFIIAIVGLIEMSGYGFFASLFRLIRSVSL